MQFQTNPRQLARLISRRMQIAFAAGLLLGIVIGWALSPIVGWVMRIGILALLLIPLVLAVFFWLSVRRANKEGSPQVFTWSNLPNGNNDPFGMRRQQRSDHSDPDIIDVESVERER